MCNMFVSSIGESKNRVWELTPVEREFAKRLQNDTIDSLHLDTQLFVISIYNSSFGRERRVS